MAARGDRSDLGPRLLAAAIAIPLAVIMVWEGELVLVAGLSLLSVVALSELYTLMRRVRPIDIAGFLTVIGMILAAHYGEQRHVLIVLACAFPVTFLFSFLRTRMEHVAWAVAATLFGALWIGLPMAHAVFLRELPHGDGLLIDVLVGTFVGDTVAYFVGRRFGRTPLAPDISPNKTVEGLFGGFLGATIAFWCAGLYQDWLSGSDALVIGALVAFVAPIGDLFESMIKRDLEVKDTGRFFGAHGGVLDRLDAVFFTVVVGYYASVPLGYG
jgi:phosphatidate cytidylyltransferase